MQGVRLFAPLVLLCSLLVVGCSGGSGKFSVTTPPSSTTAPASLTLTDMPPTGVTVLSFQITVTGAALNPGNVSLVSAPITIEVTRLQTENAFLSTLNVPAGTFNSITITFANPVLTFKNDTAGTIAGCAPGAVCEIKPGAAGSVMFSAPPFPVTITANTPAGLLVDVNLNNIISGTVGIDFTAPGGVTIAQLPSVQPTSPLEEIDDVIGQITSKDAVNNQFTLQTSQGPLTINVDSNTVFEDFASVCSSSNFACVAVNQIVEVDAILQGGGALLARHVEFKDNDVSEAEVEGVILSMSGATQFRMVALDEVPNVTGLNVGDVVTVNMGSSTTFSIDNEGLATNSFTFLSSADLLVGQQVQVKLLSTSSGTTANADRVRLRMSRFTATVAGAPSGSSFTVNNLPGLFTSAGINQIQVQTSSQTEFEGVAGVSGLAASNTVSLRGLLFKLISGTPVLVAEKIRKRS